MTIAIMDPNLQIGQTWHEHIVQNHKVIKDVTRPDPDYKDQEMEFNLRISTPKQKKNYT